MTVAFLSGALCLGYVTAALYFVRFWRDTRDRLFVFFAASFVLLALQRVSLMAVETAPALEPPSYALRLLAYLVILGGIIDKNLRP
jgi:hypothetical protein